MKKVKREHKATLIDIFPAGPVDVDNKIIDLVIAVNALGFSTTMSCENNVGGRVWLQFMNSEIAEQFLGLCRLSSPKLRICIQNATPHGYEFAKHKLKFKERWWVDVNPHFYPKSIRLRTSVRFPKEHLNLVIRCLNKEFKKRQEGGA